MPLWNLIRLNARVLSLAARGRWIGASQVASGYDRLAPHYDEAWLVRIAGATRVMVDRVPADLPDGVVVDLGCGTGFASGLLADRYPGHGVRACDLSAGMIARARSRPGADRISWEVSGMEPFVEALPPASVSALFAAWSIGYADWRRVLRGAARALAPGGSIGFIVNLADTLGPVRRAFLCAMAASPGEVRAAYRGSFPRSAGALRAVLEECGIRPVYQDEGTVEIAPPGVPDGLDWLLRTGVLAGFDSMLPLDRPGPARDAFVTALAADPEPLTHHYAALIGTKP